MVHSISRLCWRLAALRLHSQNLHTCKCLVAVYKKWLQRFCYLSLIPDIYINFFTYRFFSSAMAIHSKLNFEICSAEQSMIIVCSTYASLFIEKEKCSIRWVIVNKTNLIGNSLSQLTFASINYRMCAHTNTLFHLRLCSEIAIDFFFVYTWIMKCMLSYNYLFKWVKCNR